MTDQIERRGIILAGGPGERLAGSHDALQVARLAAPPEKNGGGRYLLRVLKHQAH